LRSSWAARALGCGSSRLALACALSSAWAWAGCTADTGTSTEPPSGRCASCHLQEYRATTHPPHAGVRPMTCGVCHSQTSWHPAQLVHSFPLDGAHATTACFACHQGPSPAFEGTNRQCLGCHEKDHQSADARIQHHASFASQCDTCHSTSAWKPTLPHDESALAPPGLGARPATGPALPPVSATKPPKAATGPRISTTASAAWPTKGPAPDQISGASRTKKR
jgi:hypothetical protein